MAKYTQDARPFKVDTVLGKDVLLLDRFTGVERVSSPFHYVLEMLSQDDSIDADALLRTAATVTVQLPDGSERTIHGVVKRFIQLGQTENGDLTVYQAEIVPQLWFLSLSTDCKIFQNMSVLDIAQQVLSSQGVTDVEFRCVRNYAPREFCVQYRESHFDFVSRLLEEEGIYYFFQHSSSKHVLILADDPNAINPCPGQSSARVVPMAERWQEEDVVTALRREHNAFVGRVTLRDYDPLQPSLQLESSVAGPGIEEVYDYPGRYTQPGDGERLARLRLEEREAWQQIVFGESTVRALQTGHSVSVKEHYRKDMNQTYQVLEIRHSAQAGDYKTWDEAPCDYRNEFAAIPLSVPFRPLRRTVKPVARGTQTAVVVGKAGEEIWVDGHGRVKVQFYWDRDGQKNEDSSCWVRVASTWAGKGWGLVSIPRIGQEVIVEFLEGDPDRPIITGQVYNAEMPLPFGTPGSATQSGIKSRSSKGGGGGNFNEIRLDDQKGSELFFARAEKDQQIEVVNDRSRTVGHDESVQVSNDRQKMIGNNQSLSVGNDETITIGNNEAITIGNNRTKQVAVDESVSIGSNRDKSVGANESVTIGANESVQVGANATKNVGGNEVRTVGSARSVNVAAADQLGVGGARAVTIGGADVLAVGLALTITAGLLANITVGKSSISLKTDGSIKIKGKSIEIEGSDTVAIKGSSGVAIEGETITQN
jgi:type VI secretion system secreted protein VgrG